MASIIQWALHLDSDSLDSIKEEIDRKLGDSVSILTKLTLCNEIRNEFYEKEFEVEFDETGKILKIILVDL